MRESEIHHILIPEAGGEPPVVPPGGQKGADMRFPFDMSKRERRILAVLASLILIGVAATSGLFAALLIDRGGEADGPPPHPPPPTTPPSPTVARPTSSPARAPAP